ncbi:MAG: hypothetical protein GKR94_06300 [Gammaproteobacteria bacterium]|nr:hypothetical protein [Gammaproteobacteria bacterium]NKC11813.1 hypothetical protein [Gammaproteobacteria bacterium]
MQKWTQNEAVAFECAREVITDLRAILTGQIAEEASKEHPNAERLANLRAERLRLFRERAGLRVKDQATVARVRAEYGARVRSWRAERAER